MCENCMAGAACPWIKYNHFQPKSTENVQEKSHTISQENAMYTLPTRPPAYNPEYTTYQNFNNIPKSNTFSFNMPQTSPVQNYPMQQEQKKYTAIDVISLAMDLNWSFSWDSSNPTTLFLKKSVPCAVVFETNSYYLCIHDGTDTKKFALCMTNINTVKQFLMNY